MNVLIRVESPHFVAGIVADANKPLRVAPILRRWTTSRFTLNELIAKWRRKGWTVEVWRDGELAE